MTHQQRFFIDAIEVAKLQRDIKNGEYADDVFRGNANLYDALATMSASYDAWVDHGSEGLADLAAKSKEDAVRAFRELSKQTDDFTKTTEEILSTFRKVMAEVGLATVTVQEADKSAS